MLTSKLISTLLPELFQTEESAIQHPQREAKRLASTPPAAAMLAVAKHAAEALPRFRALAKARGCDGAESGTTVGKVFSVLRDFGVDLVLSSEKSYRGTLLGIRHGLGVVMLLEHAADVAGDRELGEFCAEWLAARAGLANAAESELAWFARHPDVAMSRARSRKANKAKEHRSWPAPSTRSS